MTAPNDLSPTESRPRSRRALLAGALGGIGALAASAVGRVSPAAAVDGDPVVLGQTNTAVYTTTVESVEENLSALWGTATATTGVGVGVRGSTDSASGWGVWGVGPANGVRGESPAGTGVWGDSTSGDGVRGGSTSGTGTIGHSVSGWGVSGVSPSGTGVRGDSSTGVGGLFSTGSGFALQTQGRSKLSTSGVATIPAGSTGVTVNPGVNVVGSSFVLLTPKANIGSRGLWFTTNSTANTFRIRMSSKRSSNTKVAWLLLG